MSNNQRSRTLRSVPRKRGIVAGLALGLAFTVLGGSLTPVLALDGDTNRRAESSIPSGRDNGSGQGSELELDWDAIPGDDADAAAGDAAGSGDWTDSTGSGPGTARPGGSDAGVVESGSGGDLISPLSIPNPTSTTAVITVKVGGDRAADGSVLPLAGVRLALYGAGTGTGGGGAAAAGQVPAQGTPGALYNQSWSWTSCVSDNDGDCSFVIPIRAGTISSTGVPQDTRFWVAQTSAPTGWYTNPNVRVGGFGATPELTWQYRFRTDMQLRANTTYSSTAAMPWNTTAADPDRYFMRNRIATNTEDWYASNVGRTTGVWNQSRNNPAMIGGCPVDIALLADTSGSLGATGIASLKSTMTSFVDAFRGTNARMALFSFSSVSPGNGASNHPALLPVTTAAQATTFKAQYAGWAAGGGTNWDAGFAAVANAAPHYDLAILLTDGNPTVIRNNPDPGSSAYNAIQDVDAGIFSANQLKAEGTRVLSLGVGPALTAASEANLRAVSGTSKGTDYFRAGSFDEATEILVNLAKQRCTASIGVQKLIVPEGGTIADATPAPAGWEFGAAVTNGSATMNPASQTTIDGGEGKVEFGVSYNPGVTSAPVRINEVQQAGYDVFQVGGKNAVCVNKNTGATVTVTNTGDAAAPAFALTAPQNERIECKIYNQPKSPGKLVVEKTSDPASGTQVSPGQVVKYTLTFKNLGGQPVAVAYDDALAGVLDDADLTVQPVAESPLAATFSAATKRIAVTGTLAANDTKTVTYEVKVKDPLPATADGKLGNFVVKAGEQPPTVCEPNDPLCTEHPVRAALSWNKVDASDAATLLAGSKWKLTPYGPNGELRPSAAITIEDCVAANAAACTGQDVDPLQGRFLVRGLVPGKYQLTEIEAPAGYQLLASPIEVTVNTSVSLGNIKNVQSAVPTLPLTGGMGTFAIFLGAGGVGALVCIALLAQRRRYRRSAGSA